MDFIARAGRMFDQAHRVIALLFILLVVQTVVVLSFFGTNQSLRDQIEEMRTTLPVYVVPGSLSGVYSPTQDDMLLDAFTTLITQSLNTYTFQNLAEQYQEVKAFFSPEMLVVADEYFAEKIRVARIDSRSALFVPQRESIKVESEYDNTGEATGRRRVTIDGQLYHILAGSPVEAIPLRITMQMNKVIVSRTNPFGYMLEQYREEQL